MSDKQKEINKIYSAERIAFLEANSVCQICGSEEATQVHHKAKRGKNMLKTNTWLALCHGCHRWVHDNPAEAKSRGFLLDSWREY